MLKNLFSDSDVFDSSVAKVRSLFDMDTQSKRANTELQLIKLVADVLNSTPTAWPEHQSTTPAAHRLVNIVERCRAGISTMFYDRVAYKAVAGPTFSGLRFYGIDRESGKHYHILNLSYDAIDVWYRQ